MCALAEPRLRQTTHQKQLGIGFQRSRFIGGRGQQVGESAPVSFGASEEPTVLWECNPILFRIRPAYLNFRHERVAPNIGVLIPHYSPNQNVVESRLILIHDETLSASCERNHQ